MKMFLSIAMQHICHLTWKLEEELHHHLPLSHSPSYLLQLSLAQELCKRCSKVWGSWWEAELPGSCCSSPEKLETMWCRNTLETRDPYDCIHTDGTSQLPLPLSLSENQKLASPTSKENMTLCSPPASFLMTSDTYCPKKELQTWQCMSLRAF